MSEERLARIEVVLAGLATKADLEVAVATAVAGLATKADLAEAITGVAKNVDITKLTIDVRRLMRQSEAARDDMRVVTAIALRLEHTLADALVQLQAMVEQQLRVGDRVRALEDERETPT
jgi:hypothetical protein